MTTVVNTPSSSDSNGGMGFFLGALLLIVVFFLFFVYGLPLLRSSSGIGTPQINVPDKVDVNINQSSK